MNTRRIVSLITTLVMPVAFAAMALAGSIEARTIATADDAIVNGSIDAETYAETAASKPRNVWTTDALVEAGYDGCVAVATDTPSIENAPTAHVVRMPLAEGWNWTTMPAVEVADRIAAFGGTVDTNDDVKIVGNCY